MRSARSRLLVSLSVSGLMAIAIAVGCSSSENKTTSTGGAGGSRTGGSSTGGAAGGGGATASTGGAGGAVTSTGGSAGAAGGSSAGGKSAGGTAGGTAGAGGSVAAGGKGGTAGAGGSVAAGGKGGAGGATGGIGGAFSAVSVPLAALGTNTAMGTALFEKVGSSIKLTVTVSQVMPVSIAHGIHIHANPDCGSSPDGDGGTTLGGAAGGHWNPETHQHGTTIPTNHLGDIGNITIAADGTGSLTFTTDAWTLGTGAANDVVNHAIVLHAMVDDGTTQPTGNSGGRIACAVIR